MPEPEMQLFPDFRDEFVAYICEFVVFLGFLFNDPFLLIHSHFRFSQHGLKLCDFGTLTFLHRFEGFICPRNSKQVYKTRTNFYSSDITRRAELLLECSVFACLFLNFNQLPAAKKDIPTNVWPFLFCHCFRWQI